ncbi:MAG: succinylglutamate desuccinylase [Legionellaceae bacterium]|nr:succinylglutamate desuccinylase [Legionellaceae bacterium]
MSHHKISINGEEIMPGESRVMMLPMPKLYNWTPMNMPVHVIRGKEPGPTLCVTAAIHGDEVNGVEIIRRLLQQKILKKLRGSLIAAPILNIYGFLNQDRYLMDRRDLNRSFPGSTRGSLAGRLANLIMKDLVADSTHLIDLHTGSLHRSNLPQIRANLAKKEVRRLAKAFNAPVMLHSKERDGSFRQAVNDLKMPCLLYEAGEALRLDELSIRLGLKGILNVMVELDMLPEKVKFTPRVAPVFARDSMWVRAHHSGIMRVYKGLGAHVRKGDRLAIIANPVGGEKHHVLSPVDGLVIGRNNLPLTHDGAALFHIASFERLQHAQKKIEYMQSVNQETLLNNALYQGDMT